MSAERVPILLLSANSCKALGRRFRGIGRMLAKIFPKLSATVEKVGMEMDVDQFMVGSLFSAVIYAIIFFLIAFLALTIRSGSDEALRPALGIAIAMWFVFFMLHLIYPGIILKKIAAKESRDLLFALRELMMDVQSGVPLFDAMKNVGNANYGYISKDFEATMKMVESGVSEPEALKKLALKTESEYLKRAIWQLVNALESGSRIENALGSIVESLEAYVYRDIKNYSANLNFLMLMYMMGAAVVPSLGITFMILLSAFGGLGVTTTTVSMLVGTSVVIQIVMIGYMSISKPEIFG